TAKGASAALWNLDRPQSVREVHRAYVEAGARVLLTNTFVASRDALGVVGRAGQMTEIHQAAVAHARAAGADWVVGDLGPIWGWRHFGRPVDHAAARDAYREQAAALVEAGVDGLALETLGDPRELQAAVEGCRRAGAPAVIASMSFVQREGGFETVTGASLDEAAGAMGASGADAWGANCALFPSAMARLGKQLSERLGGPHVLKPNSGPGREGGAPSEFARIGLEMLASGASAVGGCCGAGPAHIAALAALVDHGRINGGAGRA
ncbi:MAG: homocysteine S-methyltransferase family protein, partial [Myxococcales bacterium]|nr:homocysteine S-methyltransferase family protein [Myxococcales bacterium]